MPSSTTIGRAGLIRADVSGRLWTASVTTTCGDPCTGNFGPLGALSTLVGVVLCKTMLLEPFQSQIHGRCDGTEDQPCRPFACRVGTVNRRLAAHLVERILNPADPLFRPGTESVLCAASIEQARIVFRFARTELEPSGEYRFIDSATRAAILHKSTNTRLRVIGSER